MDARLVAVADQLLLIERALRVQGWWSEQAPSVEALASSEPFCVDTLAFEEWLQWVFLPRMKQVIETGAVLPRASGIRPMAEVAYGDRLPQALELLVALDRFDRLIGGAA